MSDALFQVNHSSSSSPNSTPCSQARSASHLGISKSPMVLPTTSHKTAPLMAASTSQMLRIMQALSAEAQEAGVANMSLDEINAEIDAARNGK